MSSVLKKADKLNLSLSLVLYLPQYSVDPFCIYTSDQQLQKVCRMLRFFSKLKNLKFWQILEISNFHFVLF